MRSDSNWTTAVVRATRDVAPDVREFALAPESGAATHYPTGSHLKVRVIADGKSDLRHYSLVGDAPTPDGCWRVAVKREAPGRGGSRYMWSLPAGARLEVSRPDSHFELSRDAPEYLLVAGGIGVTPISGMAAALRRRGARFRMLYAGRSRGGMAYLDELAAGLGDRLEVFAGDEGRRIDLDAEVARLRPDGELYVCGPLPMMEAARRAWRDAGRAPARLVFETFGSGGRHAAEAFTVRVPRLGVEVRVPEDGTMLDALEAAGVGVLWDCRRGECGLCVLDVLEVEGAVDHRGVFFSEKQHAEGRKICACVSRAVGGSISVDPPFRGDGRLTPGAEGSVVRAPAAAATG